MSVKYGSLVNVQVMAGVTVNVDVSSADTPLLVSVNGKLQVDLMP